VLAPGINKAVAAGRRIAELDPYLPVRVVDSGLTEADDATERRACHASLPTPLGSKRRS